MWTIFNFALVDNLYRLLEGAEPAVAHIQVQLVRLGLRLWSLQDKTALDLESYDVMTAKKFD